MCRLGNSVVARWPKSFPEVLIIAFSEFVSVFYCLRRISKFDCCRKCAPKTTVINSI